MSFVSIDPSTGKTLSKHKEHSKAELEHMLNILAVVGPSWRKTAMAQRTKSVHALADLLDSGIEKLAACITSEMGKPITESRAEIAKCAAMCRYFADNSKHFISNEEIKGETGQSLISYEPLGTIILVMPWNFPFWQVLRCAVPAIMAGNVCLLKHAENVMGCAKEIEDLFKRAEFGEVVFRNAIVSHSKLKVAFEQPSVGGVAFTGSSKGGSAVASLAGKNLKKSVLELGGSDPFVVLKDAKLKNAVDAAVKSRFLNAGQSCIAAKRFIVEKPILKDFVSLLVQELKRIKQGDPSLEETQIGPLARPDLLKTLDAQVRSSIKKGAELLMGGKKRKGKGNFYEPTILFGVKEGMPVYHEEVFGPVACIISARDTDHAMELAADTEFGLGASIWTTDKEKGLRLARQFRAGVVGVNKMVVSDARLPFGGVGKSGYGKELGALGIREFVNAKSISID